MRHRPSINDLVSRLTQPTFSSLAKKADRSYLSSGTPTPTLSRHASSFLGHTSRAPASPSWSSRPTSSTGSNPPPTPTFSRRCGCFSAEMEAQTQTVRSFGSAHRGATHTAHTPPGVVAAAKAKFETLSTLAAMSNTTPSARSLSRSPSPLPQSPSGSRRSVPLVKISTEHEVHRPGPGAAPRSLGDQFLALSTPTMQTPINSVRARAKSPPQQPTSPERQTRPRSMTASSPSPSKGSASSIRPKVTRRSPPPPLNLDDPPRSRLLPRRPIPPAFRSPDKPNRPAVESVPQSTPRKAGVKASPLLASSSRAVKPRASAPELGAAQRQSMPPLLRPTASDVVAFPESNQSTSLPLPPHVEEEQLLPEVDDMQSIDGESDGWTGSSIDGDIVSTSELAAMVEAIDNADDDHRQLERLLSDELLSPPADLALRPHDEMGPLSDLAPPPVPFEEAASTLRIDPPVLPPPTADTAAVAPASESSAAGDLSEDEDTNEGDSTIRYEADEPLSPSLLLDLSPEDGDDEALGTKSTDVSADPAQVPHAPSGSSRLSSEKLLDDNQDRSAQPEWEPNVLDGPPEQDHGAYESDTEVDTDDETEEPASLPVLSQDPDPVKLQDAPSTSSLRAPSPSPSPPSGIDTKAQDKPIPTPIPPEPDIPPPSEETPAAFSQVSRVAMISASSEACELPVTQPAADEASQGAHEGSTTDTTAAVFGEDSRQVVPERTADAGDTVVVSATTAGASTATTTPARTPLPAVPSPAVRRSRRYSFLRNDRSRAEKADDDIVFVLGKDLPKDQPKSEKEQGHAMSPCGEAEGSQPNVPRTPLFPAPASLPDAPVEYDIAVAQHDHFDTSSPGRSLSDTSRGPPPVYSEVAPAAEQFQPPRRYAPRWSLPLGAWTPKPPVFDSPTESSSPSKTEAEVQPDDGPLGPPNNDESYDFCPGAWPTASQGAEPKAEGNAKRTRSRWSLSSRNPQPARARTPTPPPPAVEEYIPTPVPAPTSKRSTKRWSLDWLWRRPEPSSMFSTQPTFHSTDQSYEPERYEPQRYEHEHQHEYETQYTTSPLTPSYDFLATSTRRGERARLPWETALRPLGPLPALSESTVTDARPKARLRPPRKHATDLDTTAVLKTLDKVSYVSTCPHRPLKRRCPAHFGTDEHIRKRRRLVRRRSKPSNRKKLSPNNNKSKTKATPAKSRKKPSSVPTSGTKIKSRGEEIKASKSKSKSKSKSAKKRREKLEDGGVSAKLKLKSKKRERRIKDADMAV